MSSVSASSSRYRCSIPVSVSIVRRSSRVNLKGGHEPAESVDLIVDAPGHISLGRPSSSKFDGERNGHRRKHVKERRLAVGSLDLVEQLPEQRSDCRELAAGLDDLLVPSESGPDEIQDRSVAQPAWHIPRSNPSIRTLVRCAGGRSPWRGLHRRLGVAGSGGFFVGTTSNSFL